jgi:hypothetical protein
MVGAFGWRRYIRASSIGVALLTMTALADPPGITAFGYARETLPGVPTVQGSSEGEGGRSTGKLPTEYFIYAETAPGTRASVKWVAVHGQFCAASLQRVSTPVLVDQDAAVPTGKKVTLVPATKNDVYRVVVGDKLAASLEDDKVGTLVQQNNAVVLMTVDNAPTYVLVKALRPLAPKAGM